MRCLRLTTMIACSGVAAIAMGGCAVEEPTADNVHGPMNTPIGDRYRPGALVPPDLRTPAPKPREVPYADIKQELSELQFQINETATAMEHAFAKQYDRQMERIDGHLADLEKKLSAADGDSHEALKDAYDELQKDRAAIAREWEIFRESCVDSWEESQAKISEHLNALNDRVDALAENPAPRSS